jgi:anti-sigma factor (TIGR02949 family)
MIDHRDVRERLSVYLDEELDPVASDAVSSHLESCPECSRELGRLRSLQSVLRGHVETHVAPARLRARVGALTGRPAPAPRRFGWERIFAWAGAAAVAAAAWLVVVRLPANAEQALATEVVSSHVRSMMASHLTDVTSTDQHTVKPWFDGKLDFAPPVTDLAAQGFPLLGGRLDYLGGHTVAALVYGRRKHVINLFLWPRNGDRPAREVTLRGYHTVHGAKNGMEYWAVSDVNAQDLEALVQGLGLSTK